MNTAGEPRRARALALPTWLLLALVMLPLANGARTLYYRDVLGSHYPLKAAQAQLQDGSLSPPLIDPFRGGGQPLLGNPNAVPFYPTNVLFRFAHPLWALNAHFWLHWLLAPLCGYWMGRSWRLGRGGAWACGVAWATGGYVLSLLNLYNMVAVAALAPALVASFVGLARSPSARRIAPAALVTGLVVLGGDPAGAALCLLLAGTAWLAVTRSGEARGVERPSLPATGRALAAPVLALVLGVMLAAPVVTEMLRILPRSYRGFRSYSADTVLGQSWHPATLLDWWIPGLFGRIDFTFWGGTLFSGNPPLLGSLLPGWIVVALALVAGVSARRLCLWSWGAVALGLFLALGLHNPLLHLAASWPGAGFLRFPVKAWLAVALGLSLLAGLGFERLARGARRGVFLGLLFSILGSSVLLRVWLSPDSPLTQRLVSLAPEHLSGPFLLTEIDRWSKALALSCLALGAAIVITVFARQKPRLLALLLVTQTASQLAMLAPLYDTDDADPYMDPPVLAELLTPLASAGGRLRLEHGAHDNHFGTQRIGARATPDPSLTWWSRASFAELSHRSGIALGHSYPYVHSPEGLDSFYSVAMAQALPGLDDLSRLRLLETAGVDVLLLDRPLAGPAGRRAELVGEMESLGRSLRVYRLLHAAPATSVATRVRSADDLRAALDLLRDPSFDPRSEVVLPAKDAVDLSALDPPNSAAARWTVLADEPERLEVSVESAVPAMLTTRRAWLPLWRADVDGESAKVLVANGFQMAVAVPAGRHEVRLVLDRWPTRLALAACGLGLLATVWLWLGAPVPGRSAAGRRRAAQPRGV